MNPFHLYPQHDDAHPERPWWSRANIAQEPESVEYSPGVFITNALHIVPVYGWRRTDWHEVAGGADLAAIDAANPLPCPPPLCGQVWAWNRPIRHQAMVVSIYERTDGVPVVTFAGAESALGDGAEWPPEGAVLVSGPCAPWAPPGWMP